MMTHTVISFFKLDYTPTRAIFPNQLQVWAGLIFGVANNHSNISPAGSELSLMTIRKRFVAAHLSSGKPDHCLAASRREALSLLLRQCAWQTPALHSRIVLHQ